jgi:hypothetical protein
MNTNTSLRRITTKCTGKCLTCRAYKENAHGRVTNSMTGSRFLAGYDTTTPVCQVKNVIYCITCTKCNHQYIGETIRTVKQRFLEHRRNIINNKFKSHLIDHFNQEDHDVSHIRLQILSKVDFKLDNNKIILTNTELEWIRLLSTAYPFGMNENIKGYGNAAKNVSTNNTKEHPYLFYKFARKKNKKHTSNSNRHKKNHTFNNQETFDQLVTLSKNYETSKFYRKMKSLSNKNLNLFIMTNNNKKVNKKTSDLMSCCYMGLNTQQRAILSKISPNINVSMPFINKSQDKMNASAVFNNSSVRKIMKNWAGDEGVPRARIVYKYNDPQSRKIFNYNKHLRRINTKNLARSQKSPCICGKYPEMIYPPSGHIISGNLQTVNKELGNIIKLGTKHKFDKEINPVILASIFETSAQSFCSKIQKLYKFDTDTQNELFKCIMENFDKYSDKFFKKTSEYELASKEPIIDVSLLNGFIITPVDKAGSNYSFCCTKYYDEIMMNELGISWNNDQIICQGNETYKPTNLTEPQIIERHNKKLSSYNLAQKDENQTLPLIYAIPKMHKNPYKFRFISGAKRSSTKQLAVILLNALKVIRTHFHNYCNIIKERSGKTMCWSINNNTDILEYLLNNNNKTKSMQTYDFSTLFTKLPHDTIIVNMFELISKMFTHSKKTFMQISIHNMFGSSYYSDTEKSNNSHIAIRCTELLELLEFIVRESFVKFANINFHQICGIPMGGNASSLIADLTLSMIEYRYLQTSTHISRDSATFRYVDDLAIMNKDLPTGIYPPELSLTHEHQNSAGEINYLDLTITFPSCDIKLFNKTDHFNFNVINSMNVNCAISKNTTFGILISQMIRYARINTNCDTFIICTKGLFEGHIRNGHEKYLLCNAIGKYCKAYPGMLFKFGLFSKKETIHKITQAILWKE